MKARRLTVLASLLAAGMLSPPLLADPPDSTLLELIERQNAQLQALTERLNALEAERSADAADAGTTESVEALYDEIEDLQLQVSQLSLGAGSTATDGPTSWRAGGPEFRSADGFYRLRVRGRVAFDASTTSGSAYDERNITGTEMRAIRLGAEGRIGAMR